MFVILVGPKGSGKSHIGRVLERRLGVHFLKVEPLWMAHAARCRAAGREPDIAGGIAAVHPEVTRAIGRHRHVCVETTGASPEILDGLRSLAPPADTLVVRVRAPLALCLERIATRDPSHQIPMDLESIRNVHRLSLAAEVEAALVLDNVALSDREIASAFDSALAPPSAGPPRGGR